MSVITTKQLRENMPKVVHDLQQGKSVQLSYRHKVIGVLEPVKVQDGALRRGSAQAVQRFLRAANFGIIPSKLQNSRLSVKEQIAQLRSRDLSSR